MILEIKYLLDIAKENGITVYFADTSKDLININPEDTDIVITAAMTIEEIIKQIYLKLFRLNIEVFNIDYEDIKKLIILS